MEPGFLLILIVFVVAPLIEKLLKAGKGAQQPPEQRPQQRIPPQQRVPQPRPQARLPQQHREERAGRSDEAAADMLPDDLWEILTGERRTPRAPAPAPEVEPQDIEERYPVEAYPDESLSLEEAALEQPSPRGWPSRLPEDTAVVLSPEAYERPLPERDVPRVVSLEELEFDTEKRHDRFHKRLDTLKPAARVRRPAPSLYRFTNDEDVRRAIVMSEILGPPKGLE
ncbi:MAG TPA: hypothetical protein VK912_00945 [Longimicrobiales bacterium]|nr:hypothetical protein [Longimicrobiales bacterium]